MPERFETYSFKKKYINILRELKKYDISENDFNDYMYILEKDIEEEIENRGRVPGYAYKMIIKDVLLYEFRESVYLKLLCGFDIIKGKKEDIKIVGPFIEDLTDSNGNLYLEYIEDLKDDTIQNEYLFPSSADAVMDLTTGEHSASVNWEDMYSWQISMPDV